MYYEYDQPNKTVAQKKKIAQQKLAELRKTNPRIQPVVVTGKKLVTTWWGKAWTDNIESYADGDNRISHGKSYVRNGFILDLQIDRASVDALVQCNETYKVSIEIDLLDKEKWQQIEKNCQGKLGSLQALLDGKFPKSLGEVFTNQQSGLFPSLSEISFRCNCPIWTGMCKHVAAVLYGVGVRLDSHPTLFFTLRDVAIDNLINKAVENKKLSFLEKAQKKSSRVLNDSDLALLFGIDIDDIHFATSQNVKKPEPSKVTECKKVDDNENISHLKDSEQRVLQLLQREKHCSASDKMFAEQAQVSSPHLRTVLEKLVKHGYAKKEKHGRKVTFSIIV
ncbi:SWIM zinc finger family protein [Candidatus Uabimicrobium amorphum]|uniref:SWIM-type domain-containing protein n=1 Tax=Uabimicrobium amorphum TaxID=2596890 RepID=A0A5S9IP70_UABAM|nr:hypothetical protein [Candidatus Uabimicrobium amorphum]BBM84145.1 hypothetical protein UABAM_02501 [Candidatus Uabimicrobium amorphum]